MRSGDRLFTDGEMAELLRRLRAKARHGRLIDKADYAIVTFAWATGCRASEMASVSLDPTAGNRLDPGSGIVTITDAKWDSKGIIPLDARSVRIIRWFIRDVRPRFRNAAIMRTLFLTKTGRPYTSNTMTKKLGLLLKRMGFAGKTAHSFRHFFCTDMLRRGTRLHEAKALMRHRDVRSTMVYSHATLDDLRAAINRRLS
jgi:integrase/recombinase XerD